MNHEEKPVVDALVQLFKDQRIKCLIQIGADDGYEAYIIKRETRCRAIAIEANVNTPSCSPAIEFHHSIIGAEDGETTFYVHENTGLSGHFPRGSNEQAVETWQHRLDSWCSMRGGIQPDALIIDTEGSTMEVLEGCGLLLDGVNVVYAEVQSKEIRPGIRLVAEVDEFLSERGMVKHEDMPSYGVGDPQYNMTWVRESRV